MASPTLVEAQEQIVADRGREDAADRRRWRRALAVAVVVHLLILAAPRPQPAAGPPETPGDVRTFPLTEVRPAPPEPPAPVIPEVVPDPDEPPPEPEEIETAPPGPPAPPRIEVLFPEGDLSRLSPPRPVQAVPPPAPPEAPAAGGEVRIYLQLDERGQVYGVRAAAGDPVLLDAAISVARAWVFFPATLDGEPIPVVVEVVVRFPPRPEPETITPD